MRRFVEPGESRYRRVHSKGQGGTASQTGLPYSGFTGLETMKNAAFIFSEHCIKKFGNDPVVIIL